MGKLWGEEGAVRVVGQVEGVVGGHWVVREGGCAGGRVYRFRVGGVGGDARLGDVGQVVDVEGVRTAAGDFLVRAAVVVEGDVDWGVLNALR